MVRLRSLLSRVLVAGCLTVAFVEPPAPAYAQPSAKELSKARAKFQQATELEHAGQYAQALELFREVGQIRMTPQVRFHIAFCEEKLGRMVAALGGYQLAEAEASEVGNASFEKEVRARIEDLKGRIPKIVIRRGKGAAAAKIELDGVTLGESSIGIEIPMDPGGHAIDAKAPGHEPFSITVEIAESDKKEVEVVLKKIEQPAGGGGGGSGPDGSGPVTADKPPSKVPPLVVGGVGVAALAAAGVFFYLRQDALGKLEDACAGGSCPPDRKDELQGTYDDLKTYNMLTQISAGVGVVCIGVGLTWLVLQKEAPKERTGRLQLAPVAPGAQAGMSVLGRF
jgi:hypothetical protein